MRVEKASKQQLIDTFVVAAHGDFDKVKSLLLNNPLLISRRASWDESAIDAAAQTGRMDFAPYLSCSGAVMDICTATMEGWEADVRRILVDNPKQIHAVGAHGIPLLYFAVIRSNLELASYLPDKGAMVNGGDGSSTALHAAMQFNQPGIVTWLIERRADPSAKNYDSKTPTELAKELGNPIIINCFN